MSADRPQHKVTTYLAVPELRRAIDWYSEVFSAQLEGEPIVDDDGRIGHAELRFGDTLLMMADEFPELGFVGPDRERGAVCSMVITVDDPFRTFDQAVVAGAKVDRPVAETDRGTIGWLYDPFGHRWGISG